MDTWASTHLLKGVKESPEGVFFGGGAVQQVVPDGLLGDFLDFPLGFFHIPLRPLDLITPTPRPDHVTFVGAHIHQTL